MLTCLTKAKFDLQEKNYLSKSQDKVASGYMKNRNIISRRELKPFKGFSHL